MVDLLLIEDNVDLLKVLREAVELNGYRVTVGRDAEAGLECLNSGYQPAVIICDISLPHMDGLEFLRRIRANPAWADIQFIAMSGNNDLKKDALEAGADHYLTKPFSFYDLYTLLAQEPPPEN